MRKTAISASIAFFAVSSIGFAQETAAQTSGQDIFFEAVDDHIEGEIKDKIRENLTQRLLDVIKNQSLSDLAKKIPGVLAKRNQFAVLIDGIRMATTIAPAGLDSDVVTLSQPTNIRQSLIDGVIMEECGGRGKIDDQAIHSADLNIDGSEDFIIDLAGLTCSSGAMPLNCGAQVCNSYFYLYGDGDYNRVWEQLAYVEEITDNTPPNVVLYLHGGNRVRAYWNGGGFSTWSP